MPGFFRVHSLDNDPEFLKSGAKEKARVVGDHSACFKMSWVAKGLRRLLALQPEQLQQGLQQAWLNDQG